MGEGHLGLAPVQQEVRLDVLGVDVRDAPARSVEDLIYIDIYIYSTPTR